jgi:hypothetical protein
MIFVFGWCFGSRSGERNRVYSSENRRSRFGRPLLVQIGFGVTEENGGGVFKLYAHL